MSDTDKPFRMRTFDLTTDNEKYLYDECLKDKRRIAMLEAEIYDAYELGQDDARSNAIHGYGSEPYKDKAQVLAALKESEL